MYTTQYVAEWDWNSKNEERTKHATVIPMIASSLSAIIAVRVAIRTLHSVAAPLVMSHRSLLVQSHYAPFREL